MRRPWELVRRPRSRIARACRARVAGRRGLEIGGPSRIFSRKGRIPLYPFVEVLDGCDFRRDTTWSRGREVDAHFHYDAERPSGRRHLCEAVDLEALPTGAYDLVLASHVLEHIADPLRALEAWRRVTDPSDGVLVVVVPHRDGTFDHRRPVTTLEHLVEDYEREVGEDDMTHLAEILELHDLSRDPGIDTFEAFERRSRANADNRCLHHHVFDTELAIRLLDRAGWTIEQLDVVRPYHVMLLAGKVPCPDNAAWLARDAAWRRRSPFPSDRRPRS